MKKIIHIPHTSTLIPDEYRGEFLLTDKEIEIEHSFMIDWFVDELVYGFKEENILKFDYSRLFCDVERLNSEKEKMNKVGMGVLYTKTHDLKPLRNNPSKEIIDLYYKPHHEKFYNLTKDYLEQDDVLIVDLHSYPNEKLPYELTENNERPPLCVGVDLDIKRELMINIIETIEPYNIYWKFNQPFHGSIKPLEYINHPKIHSVMLEFNRDFLSKNFTLAKKIFNDIVNINI